MTMTMTELDKLGDKQVKRWQTEHERAILEAAQTRSSKWQECYAIWGKVSLKFRYPILHGPLSRQAKDAIRLANRNYQSRIADNHNRSTAKLECEWLRAWEERIKQGTLNPIPYTLIESCLIYDKTDATEGYYSMRAVRYLEERLATQLLLSDIPVDTVGAKYCKSAWPKE